MPEVTLGLANGFSHGRVISEASPVTSPAAGAGFTITVNSRYWERASSLAFRLVSDGNAANRQVRLTVNDGDGVPLASIPTAAVQAASLTRDYYFLPNVNAASGPVDGVFLSPLPIFFLQPTWTLVVSIASVQATDQVSLIRWNRDRFITGPGGYEIGTTYVEDADMGRLQVFADELA